MAPFPGVRALAQGPSTIAVPGVHLLLLPACVRPRLLWEGCTRGHTFLSSLGYLRETPRP